MAIPATSEKVFLNFGWEGPSSGRDGFDVEVVGLLFKNAKTEINVHIPSDRFPEMVKKLSFICRRYHGAECGLSDTKSFVQETYPDSLKVTVEQIRNLTIKAGTFVTSYHPDSSGSTDCKKGVLWLEREIKPEMPEDLEIGKTYRLVVTSNVFSLSASVLKEETAHDIMKDEEEVINAQISPSESLQSAETQGGAFKRFEKCNLL